MDDGNIADFEFFERLLGKICELLEGHLFVSFVVEIESLPAARLVAYHAFEDDRSPVLAPLDASNNTRRVNGITNDRSEVRTVAPPSRRLSGERALSLPKGRPALRFPRTSAYRRPQRNPVAGLELSPCPGILLIHLHSPRGPPISQTP